MTAENRIATVGWICDVAQRPDKWMLTIVNVTWTVDDLPYHQWIYVVDPRTCSAADAAIYFVIVIVVVIIIIIITNLLVSQSVLSSALPK